MKKTFVAYLLMMACLLSACGNGKETVSREDRVEEAANEETDEDSKDVTEKITDEVSDTPAAENDAEGNTESTEKEASVEEMAEESSQLPEQKEISPEELSGILQSITGIANRYREAESEMLDFTVPWTYEFIYMNEDSIPELVVYDGWRSILIEGDAATVFEIDEDPTYPSTVYFKERSGVFFIRRYEKLNVTDYVKAYHSYRPETEQLGVYRTDGTYWAIDDVEVSEEDYQKRHLPFESFKEVIPKYDSIKAAADAIGLGYLLENESSADEVAGGEHANDETANDENTNNESAGSAENLVVVEEEVTVIRSIYNYIQDNLDNFTKQDGGSNIIRYLDDNGKIRKIYAPAGTYSDDSGAEASKYEAEFFYDENERLVFAFVYKKGEAHRFYVKDCKCIRYIDEDHEIYDFPEKKDASDVCGLGVFIDFGLLEIHYAYV